MTARFEVVGRRREIRICPDCNGPAIGWKYTQAGVTRRCTQGHNWDTTWGVEQAANRQTVIDSFNGPTILG